MSNFIKYIFESALMLIPALVALSFHLFLQPIQRGFFCNDESIMYPFGADTISTWTIAIVGIIFSVAFIVAVETGLQYFDPSYNTSDSRNHRKSPYVKNLDDHISFLLFAISINQFLTDGTKYALGKLRPHFMDLCRPVLPNGSTCSDPNNWNRYIQEFTCSNINASERELKNARLSFPSGHTSFAFVCAFYCVFYLESRIKHKDLKITKHFVQLLIIAGALYTGLSRISDYKHHAADVIGGLILAFIVAYAVCFHISKLFKKKRYVDEQA